MLGKSESTFIRPLNIFLVLQWHFDPERRTLEILLINFTSLIANCNPRNAWFLPFVATATQYRNTGQKAVVWYNCLKYRNCLLRYFRFILGLRDNFVGLKIQFALKKATFGANFITYFMDDVGWCKLKAFLSSEI